MAADHQQSLNDCFSRLLLLPSLSPETGDGFFSPVSVIRNVAVVELSRGRQKPLRLGPRVAPGGVFGGRAGDGYGVGRRVDMGTSGGTSLCSQSGKHFRELCWVGDSLIIEE